MNSDVTIWNLFSIPLISSSLGLPFGYSAHEDVGVEDNAQHPIILLIPAPSSSDRCYFIQNLSLRQLQPLLVHHLENLLPFLPDVRKFQLLHYHSVPSSEDYKLHPRFDSQLLPQGLRYDYLPLLADRSHFRFLCHVLSVGITYFLTYNGFLRSSQAFIRDPGFWGAG